LKRLNILRNTPVTKQDLPLRIRRAAEAFNEHAKRADGARVALSLNSGLTVVKDTLFLRLHTDVELYWRRRFVNRPNHWVLAAVGLVCLVSALTTFEVLARGSEPAVEKSPAAAAAIPALAGGGAANPRPQFAHFAEATPCPCGGTLLAARELWSRKDRAQFIPDELFPSLSRNVFGKDPRKPLISTQYPWRTIGMITGCGSCTGTPVGRDLVLTAAHCVMDNATKALNKKRSYFCPNYKGGKYKDRAWISHVWWGTNDASHHPGQDWAILQLDKPLGDQYGWLPVRYTDCRSFPAVITVAGYSYDFDHGRTASIHANGHTRRRLPDDNLIHHDCANTRGASGGPVLAMYNGVLTIVGINVGEGRQGREKSLRFGGYDDRFPNAAIPTNRAFFKLKELLKTH
jgi:protease YdgD